MADSPGRAPGRAPTGSGGGRHTSDTSDGSDNSGGSGGSGGARRSKTPVALIAAVAVGAVLALLVAVLATREPATTRVAESPLVGERIPVTEASTIGGGEWSYQRYRGSWLLMNFFATWCTPCKVEHPELRRFAESHAGLGDAAVVSVVYDDTVAEVERYFATEGGEWPVLRDADGRMALEYGVLGVPESYLVGPGGIVRAKITGGVEASALDSVIAELSGGRS